jgi:cellobiose-specific phosphotransferase system component IIC
MTGWMRHEGREMIRDAIIIVLAVIIIGAFALLLSFIVSSL